MQLSFQAAVATVFILCDAIHSVCLDDGPLRQTASMRCINASRRLMAVRRSGGSAAENA